MEKTLAESPGGRGSSVKPRVFVSRPAVLSKEQDVRSQQWFRHLASLGFEFFALERSSYDIVPWNQVRSAVEEADGVLILGFRQLQVDQGLWRPGTTECRLAPRWWGTPWNHIEAGLALMTPAPVLVAPEEGVTEGVFCSELWGGNLFGAALEVNLEHGPVPAEDNGARSRAAVAAWAQAVKDRGSSRPVSANPLQTL
jgi:hypothetical protein